MSISISNLHNWQPDNDWNRITTIDAHTAGEPLRIITGGYPELLGKNILEKRANALKHYDHLRKTLMWEPRGHADMYGCIVTSPVTEDADFGVLFLHNEGYSSMCGHGIIAISKVAIMTGMIKPVEPTTTIKIDSPAGLITSYVDISNNHPTNVRFQNVPSYVDELDITLDVPEYGTIKYDLAFGGAFYAYLDVAQIGLTCLAKDHDALVLAGKKIKQAVMKSRKIEHPFQDDLGFLYGVIFIDKPTNKNHHSRNVCVFAEGEVDRSPTGTGVSARMAIHYVRNEVAIGEEIIIESIVGSTFTGKVISETTFGKYKAIIPEVGGNAYITGQHTFIVDPEDPLADGFIMR